MRLSSNLPWGRPVLRERMARGVERNGRCPDPRDEHTRGRLQLSAKSREKALEYIDEFYALIAEPQRVERAFGSNCGG